MSKFAYTLIIVNNETGDQVGTYSCVASSAKAAERLLTDTQAILDAAQAGVHLLMQYKLPLSDKGKE